MDSAPVPDKPKKRRFRRAVIAGVLTVTLTAGGGTAWALDRFVIEHVEISDVAAYESSQAGTAAATSSAPSNVTERVPARAWGRVALAGVLG